MASAGDESADGIGRRLRWLVGQLLPPVIAEPLRRARRRRLDARAAPGAMQAPPAPASETQAPAALPDWEYLPGGWPDDDPTVRGWDSGAVADTLLDRWPGFLASVAGVAPLGFESGEPTPTVDDYARHNTILSFGYVLARAAAGRDRLSMLDWGGGIGRYRVYAKALMPDLALDYSCRELPSLARAGRQVQPDAIFHDDDDSALERTYDLVIASGSLHYRRDWRAVLGRLAAASTGYLFVTRQPFVATVPSYVVLQRPWSLGYQTEYAGWFLNRDEFLADARSHGLTLEREFLIDERPPVAGAPEPADYRGFLFSSPGRVPA